MKSGATEQTLPVADHNRGATNESDWTDDLEALGEKMKSYMKQTAVWVGRNSFFHLDDLTDEELEEVGGVEFGAIRVLSWLVPAVRPSFFFAHRITLR